MNKVMDWDAKRKYARGLTREELEFAIQDCIQARDAARGWSPENEGYYQDEASVYSAELRARDRAAAVKAASAALRRLRKGGQGAAGLGAWAEANLPSLIPAEREAVTAEALRRAGATE